MTTNQRECATSNQRHTAAHFHELHHGGTVLVLPNAWDVASARLVEEAGAAAVATTSAGVAWSLGSPDGDRLHRDLAVDLVARIAAAVRVPLTADIESGYAPDPAGVAETVRLVIDAGAVGINLEDAHHGGSQPLRTLPDQQKRIAAARQAAEETGIPLFVNARIDTYLYGVGEEAGRLAETLTRAEAYLAAGADGIFVPGVTDLPTVGALASGIAAPLNIMTGPGAPTAAAFAAAGAARVSAGPCLALAAYAAARRDARRFLASGGLDAPAEPLGFGEVNALLPAASATEDTAPR